MKKRLLSLVLVAVMAVGMLAACGKEEEQVETVEAPLIVGYTSFNEVFSPFFARSEADKDVTAMTQVNLITLDRMGSVIYNGIEGETIAYNGTDYTYYGIADIKVNTRRDGTVVYDFILREDVKFSDGEILDADDVIFSMYVLCDPMYDGPYTLGDAPIQGLEEYQSSMVTLFDALIFAGRDNTDYTFWDQATQEAFWKELEAAGTQFAQDIVDYLAETSGTTSIAKAAKLWGYEGLTDNTSTTEFFYLMCEAYEWDLEALSKTEAAGKSLFSLMENYDNYTKGVQFDLDVTHITGIEKTGEYSVRVTMTEQNASNIQYFNIPVAPAHYYGNPSLYQPEENQFGFVKGDLSLLHEDAIHVNKDIAPMGAGPYVFVPAEENDDGQGISEVNFKANENYYLGKAKTEVVNFVEISNAKKINGIVSGKIDITDVSLTKKVANNIEEANQKVVDKAVEEAAKNGTEIDPATIADAVTSISFDDTSYGYIGMNADIINVNGDADSKESIALRKAFATLFAVYREAVIENYYGGNATVIDYPISNTSWAAPNTEQKGYKEAYSVGIDGEAIYTEEMSLEEKYVAAKEEALKFFEKAGYTVENGVVTSAPEGALMRFDVMISANGLGEHPSYMILVQTKETLAEMGINLVIKDVTEDNQVWEAIDAGTCGIWVAAWDASADPDIYDLYHADGAYSYMYGIDDADLSSNIEKARKETDQSDRAKLYKKCFDIILDWAVEVPVYQKQNCIIYSDARINKDTLTPDMTEYYGWIDEVHNIEMYDIVVEEE